MSDEQAESLIDELHELNKTLKAIISSQERNEKSSVEEFTESLNRYLEANDYQ